MTNDRQLFEQCLAQMIANPEIQRLKEIPQHEGGNTFDHCVDVARMSFDLAEKFHVKIEPEALVHGAMLHDYYLYDTRTMPYSDYRHALLHPKLALEKAKKLYALSDLEKNIILSHMWPIPGSPLPRSREAWLITLADKICATQEMHAGRRAKKP